MKKYQFVEPHITGGDAVITITEDKIIEFMRKSYPEHANLSDVDLLDSFIVTNWAWEVFPLSKVGNNVISVATEDG